MAQHCRPLTENPSIVSFDRCPKRRRQGKSAMLVPNRNVGVSILKNSNTGIGFVGLNLSLPFCSKIWRHFCIALFELAEANECDCQTIKKLPLRPPEPGGDTQSFCFHSRRASPHTRVSTRLRVKAWPMNVWSKNQPVSRYWNHTSPTHPGAHFAQKSHASR